MASPENSMQWLKSLVIGMGILILLGLALLTFGFIKKTGDPSWRLFSSQAPSGTPPATPTPRKGGPLKAFGELNLPLPQGCAIGRITPDGERAYIKLRPQGATKGATKGAPSGAATNGPCNRIIVIDAARGRVLGTIRPSP